MPSPVFQALAPGTAVVSDTKLFTWRRADLQNTRRTVISHNQVSRPPQQPCKYLLSVGCWRTKETMISDFLSLWKESSCAEKGSQSSEIWGLRLMRFRHWSYTYSLRLTWRQEISLYIPFRAKQLKDMLHQSDHYTLEPS